MCRGYSLRYDHAWVVTLLNKKVLEDSKDDLLLKAQKEFGDDEAVNITYDRKPSFILCILNL